MDVPFFLLCTLILCIFLLSITVLALAGRLAEKTLPNLQLSNEQKTIIYRFLALLGLFACFGITASALPQTAFGKRFLGQYYFSKFEKNHTPADARKAFSLWQQAKDTEQFRQAAARLPENSVLWKDLLRRSIPVVAGKENPSAAISYLEGLKSKVTHPMALSAITYELGAATLAIDSHKASQYFQQVLDLNSDPESMDHARGDLKEINNLNIGQISPDFHLTTIEGQAINRTDLLGKVILLQFWSSHCPSCIKEIPKLKNIQSKFAGKNFLMIGLAMEDNPETLQFIKANAMPQPQVTINSATAPKIVENFNVQFIPANFIIDKEGKIAFKRVRGEKLEEVLRQLLPE